MIATDELVWQRRGAHLVLTGGRYRIVQDVLHATVGGREIHATYHRPFYGIYDYALGADDRQLVAVYTHLDGARDWRP